MFSFEQVCAILTAEPYSLSIHDVSRLTDYQLRWVFFPDRDDQQRPLPRPRTDRGIACRPKTYREFFFYIWEDVRKFAHEEVVKLWVAYVAERKTARQPVSPRTGKPVYKNTVFDPIMVNEPRAEEPPAESPPQDRAQQKLEEILAME